MAVTLGDLLAAIDAGDAAPLGELCRIGAEAHGAAEIAALAALLELVAAHPLGHQADDRLVGRPELGGVGTGDTDEIAGRLQARHLHAEADAEVGDAALARKLG